MGADIANRVDGHEPRVEHFRAHPKIVGYLMPYRHGGTFVERYHHAEIHHVNENPIRGKIVFVAVLVVKVLRKGLALPCPTVSFMALVNEATVSLPAQTRKIVCVQKSEGSGLLCQEICQLGSHVYLNALYGIEHDKAKLPVEHIHVPNALKRRPFPKDIRSSLLVDMPVSTEAVVSDILEVTDEVISIRKQAPLPHEKVRLLLKR